MTGNNDLRDKGRAVFLAAIMVLSMVAMSATFAGAAAADQHDVEVNIGDIDGDQGDTVQLEVEIAAGPGDEPFEGDHQVDLDYNPDHLDYVGAEGADAITLTDAAGTEYDYAVGDDAGAGEVGFSIGDQIEPELPLTGTLEFEVATGDEVSSDITVAETSGTAFDGVTAETNPGTATFNQQANNELTFDDQMVQDGQVDVEDITTAQDTHLVITYEDGDDLVITGLMGGLDDEDSTDEQVDIDEAGVPGDHTAHLIPTNDLSDTDYSAGDVVSTDTAGAVVAQDTASISEEEEDLITDEDVEVAYGEEGPRYWEGQIVKVTGFEANEDVDVHRFDSDADDDLGSLVRERSANSQGNLRLDTAGLDDGEDYILAAQGDSTADTGNDFTILVQDLEVFDIGADQVRLDSATDLSIQSDRRNFDIEITETQQDLDADTVADLFNEEDVEGTTDDGALLSLTGSEGTFDMSVPDSLATGNYTFEGDVTDTTASASDDVEFLEEGDLFVDFAQNSVTEERGDSATFGVEFAGTSQGIIQIEDSGSNYVANLSVQANNDGEALISWNTFEAAQGNPDDAFTALEGSILDVEETLDLTEGERTQTRIIEDDYDLASYIESTDDLSEVDIDDLNEDNVATIFINDVDERALDAQSWVAPAGSIDVANDDLDDILGVVSQDSTVANEDFAVVEFGAQGVFGYLTDANGSVNADQGLSVTVSEPDQAYDAGASFTTAEDGIDLVANPAGDEMFLVVDTDEVDGIAPGVEYEAAFTITDDNEYLADDELQQASTSFTIEERNVDVTGIFEDGVLQVENGPETDLTAQTNLAPGSNLFMRARARSPAPFLEDATVQVDEDGVATATFDFSERDVGTEFTTTARDRVGGVEDVTDSVFVAATDEDQPAFFGVSNLQPASANVDPGDEVTVTATVTNEGDEAGTKDIEFTLDGEVIDSVEEELEPGDSVDVEFTTDAPDVEETTAFEHAVQTEDDSAIGTLTVEVETDDDGDDEPADPSDDEPADPSDDEPTDDEEDDGAPGFGIAVALLAILGAALLAVRRQN